MKRKSTAAEVERRDIDGKGRTLWELFDNRRYAIDTYQREYKWQDKQIRELIDDLSGKFLEDHQPGNSRAQVADYAHYFLGSIIISRRNGESFVVDGQQRLVMPPRIQGVDRFGQALLAGTGLADEQDGQITEVTGLDHPAKNRAQSRTRAQ